MSRAIVHAAPAKLNLALEVIGRRDDGFHELRSIFATVDLADRVRVAGGRALDVRIRPPLDTAIDASADTDLGTRAVLAIAAATGRAPLAHVRIRKRIPVAAGLGGGSSDAGAVLVALAEIWNVEVDLAAIAAGLGSDVPFFVSGAPYALVAGRGERIAALAAPAAAVWAVLVRIPVRVATPAVFAELRPAEWSDGRAVEALATAFAAGTVDPARIRAVRPNGLQAAAERLCPAIADALRVADAKGIALRLSGSGPTLFWIADDRVGALRVARVLRRAGLDARPRVLGVAIPGKRASAVPLR